ncbi:MAG TPA: hypothetical protein VFM35_10810 [Candidatus Binatia bacterium]|nr:hypothetical protein [Candidatus Binatia bacterium]
MILLCLWSSAWALAGQNDVASASANPRDNVIILSNVAPSIPQLSSNEAPPVATSASDAIRPNNLASLVRPNEPLTSAIISARSPRRRAALRLVEEARNLLEAGQYEKALRRLETSLGLDANPYNYFYLALTHYRLAHYAESIAFLGVAESSFNGEPDWIAELLALKEINHGALQTMASVAPSFEPPRARMIQETPRAEPTTLDLSRAPTSHTEENQNAFVYVLAMSSSLSFFLWLLIWLASSMHMLRHGEK